MGQTRDKGHDPAANNALSRCRMDAKNEHAPRSDKPSSVRSSTFCTHLGVIKIVSLCNTRLIVEHNLLYKPSTHDDGAGEGRYCQLEVWFEWRPIDQEDRYVRSTMSIYSRTHSSSWPLIDNQSSLVKLLKKCCHVSHRMASSLDVISRGMGLREDGNLKRWAQRFLIKIQLELNRDKIE